MGTNWFQLVLIGFNGYLLETNYNHSIGILYPLVSIGTHWFQCVPIGNQLQQSNWYFVPISFNWYLGYPLETNYNNPIGILYPLVSIGTLGTHWKPITTIQLVFCTH